jgi:hypothetical protein
MTTHRILEAALAAAFALTVSLAAAFALAPQPAAAAGRKSLAASQPDCFSALARAGGPRLVCLHEAWMTDEERADVQKMTRGYLIDARCTVSVDIDRRSVDEALAASDRVFQAPPQPVTCQLQTSGGPMIVAGTFAPRVVFKDGFAVEATPGLANITGINSYLAWPVVAYVNRAPGITREMAAMINAFRARKGQQQAAR